MSKYFIKALFAVSVMISLGNIACNNNSKKPVQDQVSADESMRQEPADPSQSQRETLEKQSPYTLDQLKAIIPQQLVGAPLTGSEAKSNMGAAFVSANYLLNDSASIELNIFDCAGTEGAGIFERQYLELLKSEAPDDATQFTVGDFEGAKAVMQENKKDDVNSFTCFSKKRFLVILEGKFISIAQLKQAATTINFPK